MQIKRHNNICKQIYYAAYRKYKEFDNHVWLDDTQKCSRLEEAKITIINNKEVLPRNTGKYHKRPDVYIQQDKEITYTVERTVVKDDRVRSAYSEKLNTYKTLTERVRNDRGLKRVIIVPLVVTISGFISKFTIQKLIVCEIKIKWPPIIRELIINQIKDVNFYLNQHIDRVELEQGTSSSNSNNALRGDVSQGEKSN